MNTDISIEFFPPQTPEGVDKLRTVRAELAKLKPEFFSVTYGAGGSTPERTFAVVKEIAAEGFDAAPHLSCIGSSRESIREILAEYKAAGIKRTVALRGDLPSGMAEAGEFRYANELVEFIRAETGDWFSIEVAAYPEWHPQARNPQDDLAAFVRKDNLGYEAVRQAMQELIYNLNVPSRWGTQTPFTNLTFDWVCPDDLKEQIPVIGGEEMPFAYGDLQAEMDMINRAYIERDDGRRCEGPRFHLPDPDLQHHA